MADEQQQEGQDNREPTVLELAFKKAEEAAAAEDKTPKEAPPQQQQTQPAGQPADQAQQKPERPKTIPVERFDQVYRKLRETEAEKLRLEGELRATKAQPAAPQEQQQQSDPVTEIEAKLDALAQKWDAGEIESMAEFKKQERLLQRELERLHGERLAEQVRPQPGAADAAMLNDQAQRLGQSYPYLAHLDEPQMDQLVQHAFIDVERELGRPADPRNTHDMLLIREHVGALSNVYGPAWAPHVKPSQPTNPGNRQAPQAQLTPQQQQRQQKAAIANRQPPDLSNIGARPDPTGLNFDKASKMSVDEWRNVPATERARILREM